MTELLGLPYSPWSEKARWALDVRQVPHTYRVYQPILGEPALRLKLRRFVGPVTVPVLTTDAGEVLGDSADIGRWADGRGEGPTLFPAGHAEAIAHFVALSESALSAGRALALARMLHDDEALGELVPGGMRRGLGSMAARVGEVGIRRTLRKYGAEGEGKEDHRRTLRAALDEIRATLAKGSDSPRTLLGRFTFADIAMAQVLISVEPPSKGVKLRPGSRRCFADPELRAAYDDLVAWRDALYAAYRP